MKLDDGRSTAFSAGSLNATNINGSGPSQVFGASSLPMNPIPNLKGNILRNKFMSHSFHLRWSLSYCNKC
ncbi:hypothetical protein CIPAW_15G010600 [Carya illinoinensis]|uniref:Uncharacterized protein n=1 Tax=Carya illinoinensis TaxID=32201 RepID=A0A8T1NA19_CARIL|nr:hypothetical protein CIPAW_15G010600 [Carya illinoinensis]